MVVADKEYVSRAVDFGWFRHVSGQQTLRQGDKLAFRIVKAPLMSLYHCQDKYFYDKISKLPVNKMNTEFLAKWRP